jgi:Protein of unknown function (DUF1236)
MNPQIAGLLSTATLFVALSLTPALAQGGPDKDAPAAGPPAGSPPEAGAAGPQSAPPHAQEPGPSDRGLVPGKGDKGKSAETPNETTGKAAKESAKPEGQPSEQKEKPADKAGKPEEKAAEQPAGETKTKDAADKPTQPKPGAAESVEGKTGDTGKGAGGGTTKVEPQQIQKVKTYFTAHKPDVKRVDRNAVSVSVGVALPASIALYPLPPDIVVVIGSCPLEYFVWGEDIVLVDSCSREVVEIIVGAA